MAFLDRTGKADEGSYAALLRQKLRCEWQGVCMRCRGVAGILMHHKATQRHKKTAFGTILTLRMYNFSQKLYIFVSISTEKSTLSYLIRRLINLHYLKIGVIFTRKQMNLRRIKKQLRHRRTYIWISLLNAALVLSLCYVYENCPYSFAGGPSVGQWIDCIKSALHLNTQKVPDDLFAINVSYDRAVVDITDEYGMPKGNADITDRSKLLRLLQQIKKADNYKYVILDIFFEDGYHTESDSALFHTIASMDRIVIPKHYGTKLADPILEQKAHYSDYHSNFIESNFVKFEFYKKGEYSLPFPVYNDLRMADGKEAVTIGHWWFLYYTKKHLCRKSVAMRFPVTMWDEYDQDGNKNFYNMGCDLVQLDSLINMADYVKDKIVVIGDYTDIDIHDTYFGKIAGCLINYNAVIALQNEDYIINWSSIIFLFALYFVVSMILTMGVSLKAKVEKIWKNVLLHVLLSFFGIGTLWLLLELIAYYLLDINMAVLIPSVYFSVYCGILNIIHITKQHKNQTKQR
jgi:hypothetical protein